MVWQAPLKPSPAPPDGSGEGPAFIDGIQFTNNIEGRYLVRNIPHCSDYDCREVGSGWELWICYTDQGRCRGAGGRGLRGGTMGVCRCRSGGRSPFFCGIFGVGPG